MRSYLDRPVPKEVIDGLLDAAVWAPSGMNEQPWRFTQSSRTGRS
nr:nitroreductase family protein [Methanothrix sp.]